MNALPKPQGRDGDLVFLSRRHFDYGFWHVLEGPDFEASLQDVLGGGFFSMVPENENASRILDPAVEEESSAALLGIVTNSINAILGEPVNDSVLGDIPTQRSHQD